MNIMKKHDITLFETIGITGSQVMARFRSYENNKMSEMCLIF